MDALTIDFVSDIICPWCFIGLTRVEQAVAQAGATVAIRMHPFQLDPGTPPEGQDLRERLRSKYGGDPEKMFERVEQAARESGIPLDFQKVRRTPNTLKAHALLGAAVDKGTQLALGRALFEAYFLEGKDVGDEATLVELGSRHGFSREEAAAALADSELLAATREATRQASQEISGVPFVVVGRKLAVSGAQPVDIFREVIERASQA